MDCAFSSFRATARRARRGGGNGNPVSASPAAAVPGCGNSLLSMDQLMALLECGGDERWGKFNVGIETGAECRRSNSSRSVSVRLGAVASGLNNAARAWSVAQSSPASRGGTLGLGQTVPHVAPVLAHPRMFFFRSLYHLHRGAVRCDTLHSWTSVLPRVKIMRYEFRLLETTRVELGAVIGHRLIERPSARIVGSVIAISSPPVCCVIKWSDPTTLELPAASDAFIRPRARGS